MESLRDTVRRQEEELERLRVEKKEIQTQEQELCGSIEKYEQNLTEELSQECQKMAAMLNRTIRIINTTGLVCILCIDI